MCKRLSGGRGRGRGSHAAQLLAVFWKHGFGSRVAQVSWQNHNQKGDVCVGEGAGGEVGLAEARVTWRGGGGGFPYSFPRRSTDQFTSHQPGGGEDGGGGGQPPLHPALNYHFPPHTLLQPSVPVAARHRCRSAYSCSWRSPVQEVTVLLRSGSGGTSTVRCLSRVSKRGISFPPPPFPQRWRGEKKKTQSKRRQKWCNTS